MPKFNFFIGGGPVALTALVLSASVSSLGAQIDAPAPALKFDTVITRAIASEQRLLQLLKTRHPVVETYVQELKPDRELGAVPLRDFYFLGKLDLANGTDVASFIPASAKTKSTLGIFAKPLTFWNDFFPEGFASRLIIDEQFDRRIYSFNYVRREFLGDVRCIVVDVKPIEAETGRFDGRVWIEDRDYNIVRFNGSYGGLAKGYPHFDSWRVNAGPNLWLPATIYTEENSYATGPLHTAIVRAQTRLWNYERQKGQQESVFTNLEVDLQKDVKDHSDASDENSPVEMQRLWLRQSEDNVIERLQHVGLLSPVGEVDTILNTVLNNLEVTNNINLEPSVRVRVMPTTPLESVSLGNTIMLSRGLIDVLPDEACLAAVLAHELSHVLLGHTINAKFAFADRLTFGDRQTLREADFGRTPEEEAEADKKALEILKNSPYKDSLPKIGLFLRMLSTRADQMPHLIRPLMGDKMASSSNDVRLSELIDKAPELQLHDTVQIAALPLGSRIKLDPWDDRLYLLKARNVPLLSAKEKMPFEITPVILHLRRQETPGTVQSSSGEVAGTLTTPVQR
jgi:hypothetical protein